MNVNEKQPPKDEENRQKEKTLINGQSLMA